MKALLTTMHDLRSALVDAANGRPADLTASPLRQRLEHKIATLPDGEVKRANERLLAKLNANPFLPVDPSTLLDQPQVRKAHDEPSPDREADEYRANLAHALGGDVIAKWDRENAEFQADLDRRMAEVRDRYPLARRPLAERIEAQERAESHYEEAEAEFGSMSRDPYFNEAFDEDEVD